MAEIDNTYQTNVGIEQGAEKIFIKENGYLKFFDVDISGQELKTAVYTQIQNTIIANTAGALSVINVPSQHGFVFYSIADAASAASAQLCSCKEGQQLVLVGRGPGSAASIVFSTLAGVTIIGILSGNASSIDFQYSSNSQPFVRLVATADDEWSVIETNGKVTIQASA